MTAGGPGNPGQPAGRDPARPQGPLAQPGGAGRAKAPQPGAQQHHGPGAGARGTGPDGGSSIPVTPVGPHSAGPDTSTSEPAGSEGGSALGGKRARSMGDAQREMANTMSAAFQERARGAVDELSGHPAVGDLFGDLVSGDVVAGNKTEIIALFPGLHGAKVGAYRVPVGPIRRCYVAPAGFGALEAAVAQRRLVVVRGRSGTGKEAAVLRALAGSDDVCVMKLDSRTDLSTLAPGQLPDCQAIVLFDLTADQLVRLDEDTVDRLGSELAAANRWLGLTVTDDLPISAAVEAAAVEVGDPPAPRTVFDRHFELGQPSATARAHLLADPEIAQLLADELGPSSSLRRAARVARMLSVGTEPAGLAAVVRARLDGRAHDECVQWFRTLPSMRAHCTALALAVLNGLPRAHVAAAADRLIELITPTTDRPDPGPVVNPFATGAGVSLEMLRATTTAGTLSAVEGDIPVTELRYLDPLFPSWVLRHAWDEHDSARPHVVGWLQELGGHSNQDVRARAAVAVGVLATRAFDFVFVRIIGSWARSEDPDLRDSAALALGPPARDPALREVVTTIVDEWIADDESPLLQATAARTFGGDAGLARPSNTLRQLAVLAEVDNLAVAVAVARSLGELVMNGTAALAGRVLTGIAGWVTSGRAQLRLVARLAFLRLTYLRGVAAPGGGRPDPAVRQLPTLLLLAMRDRRFVGQLAWLWTDGLNAADAHRAMGVSLTAWAEAVERHPAARAAVVDLLCSAALHPRTASIITRAASGWRADGGPAAPAGHDVLDRL